AHPPSAFHQSGPPVGFQDAGDYLRHLLTLPRGVPVSLRYFSDPGIKPTASLVVLIKVAIYASPRQKLTLQGIYDSFMNRFRWFRENPGEPWTRSIRHSLSLKAMFVKLGRTREEPGKGVFWTLDITQGEGDKRKRKR
ncbi:hypothetical protein R3P38DRAFT_2386804, partial [Favolaschia claudopus]